MNDIPLVELILRCVVVSLAVIGNVEWYKRFAASAFLALPKDAQARRVLLISAFFLITSTVLQMSFIPTWVTALYNTIVLGNAFIKFGYDALVKLPQRLIDKALGSVR